ncbi:MAG: DUF86 domain-containing protein [Lachnospiraceae bacterium]|nr:DUF86 domain-containing protein [Lachnospiraceae bacterium]
MENKDKEVLLKILRHAEHAIEYASKHEDCGKFQSDDMCVEATVFNLMQIGELAKVSLSDELKSSIKSIPWNQIYGLRNRIVHGYEGVNFTIVWDTIKDDLPELVKEIRSIL